MKNPNIPPFYVGQRVVSTTTYGQLIKGHEYIVRRVDKKCKCTWWVDVGHSHCVGTHCHICDYGTNDKVGWYNSKKLAPIESTFESISFKKVVEIESPLIGIN